MSQEGQILKNLEGKIINFRIGNRNPRFRQLIVKFENLPKGFKPDNLIGRKVIIKWRKKIFKGKIFRKHGKDALLILTKKGLPGQVLGDGKVYLV
ncbi:MAG: hypothetical protein ACTSVW_04340 [Candidatus Njordarchaeales archaeon]